MGVMGLQGCLWRVLWRHSYRLEEGPARHLGSGGEQIDDDGAGTSVQRCTAVPERAGCREAPPGLLRGPGKLQVGDELLHAIL